jgi:hypothetical protein
MGDNPTARLFAELLQALHDESDALVANDAAQLADAGNRRDHVMRLLAPQASALRAMRRSGSDEYERFVREAAQLAALDGGRALTGLGVSGAAAVSGRLAALRAAGSD